MGNIQVRLPDDLESDLDGLAEELHTTRSQVARNAIAEGMRSIRLDRALEKYAEGEFSLARAAQYAGVSIQQAAKKAAERGIAFYRYSPEDAEDDLETARSIIQDSDEQTD